jgi:hypothetical protein
MVAKRDLRVVVCHPGCVGLADCSVAAPPARIALQAVTVCRTTRSLRGPGFTSDCDRLEHVTRILGSADWTTDPEETSAHSFQLLGNPDSVDMNCLAARSTTGNAEVGAAVGGRAGGTPIGPERNPIPARPGGVFPT